MTIKLPEDYDGPFLLTTDEHVYGDEPQDPVYCQNVEHARAQIAHFIRSLEVAPGNIRVWLLSSVKVTKVADFTVEGLPL